MAWKQLKSKENYLKFEVGKSFEGVYKGFKERTNPFYDANNPNSSEIITDYAIEIDGLKKTLSSTAKTLKDQLQSLKTPCQVKIDCVQKGVKKWYEVWIAE